MTTLKKTGEQLEELELGPRIKSIVTKRLLISMKIQYC